MSVVFRFLSAALVGALVVVPGSAAQAAPQGKVVVKTYSNESTSKPGCGRHVVEIFNASNTTVLSVRVLTYIAVTSRTQAPYRGSVKKSWVTYTTFLKPGKRAWSTYEGSVLCTTIPESRFDSARWTTPAFIVKDATWKWEQ